MQATQEAPERCPDYRLAELSSARDLARSGAACTFQDSCTDNAQRPCKEYGLNTCHFRGQSIVDTVGSH